MSHVVLILPKGGTKSFTPPLGLLHLAAVLPERCSVTIIDQTVDPGWEGKLAAALTSDTICAGISAMTGPQLRGAREIGERLRAQRPELPIVMGGVHATLCPEQVLSEPWVDAVCIGEGELSFPRLVDAWTVGPAAAVDHIAGIGYKRGGRPILTPAPDVLFDLNDLPPLPYHLIDSALYRRYSTFYNFKRRAFLLETSRGCSYRCYYCVQSVYRQRPRTMRPESVLRHLRDIVRQGGEYVIVADDNFFLHHRHAADVLRLLADNPTGLGLFLPVRAELLTEEMTGLLHRANVRMVSVSTESGSDRILRIMGKRQRVKDSLRANRILSRYPIMSNFNFIVGYPEETLRDITDSYWCMVRLMRDNPRAKVSINRLIPTPGSAVYRHYVDRGFPELRRYDDWLDVTGLDWRSLTCIDPAVVERYFAMYRVQMLLRVLGLARTHPDSWRNKLRRLALTPLLHAVSLVVHWQRRRCRAPAG